MLASTHRRALLLCCGGLLVLSLSFLAPLGGVRSVRAQEAPGPLRISQVIVSDDGKSVKSFVSLSDAFGRPLQGQFDFDAQIDGKGTHLSSVHPVIDEDAGLAVLLLIDVSGSMEGEPLAQARSAAASFIDGLLPKDTAAVVPFADAAPATASFTGDRAVLLSGIDSLAASGGTALHDAVVGGIALAKTAPSERRAIVLLTDGKDSGSVSTHTREQAIDEAAQAGIPIFTIGLGADADTDLLRDLAAKGGGQFYRAPAPSDVPAIFDALSSSLRSLYVLTLPLSKATTANRTILVSTSLDGTVVSHTMLFLAPQAVIPAASDSSTNIPAFVWLLPIAAAILVPLLLVVRSLWRSRRRRGAARGGPAGEGDVWLPAPQQSERAPLEALQGTLLVVAGPSAGMSVRVGETPIEIGSGPSCGLQIAAEDGAVGSVHARVWLRSKRLMVHHLARGPQTLLAGRPIEWASLESNDAIAIGSHVITFALEGS